MTTAPCCPQCGKSLSSDAPQGLCPECLLTAALAGPSGATGFNESSSADTIAPEAGVRLRYFGDYELIEEIARGGMGVVWKARQTSLNRTVALKMIRAGALASAEEVTRFLREAEAAANLQHPNIVAIHEVGEHDGQHYFSMDYVAGRDLGALAREGPLSAQRAARYVQIIAEAIHFAHQRGTLHRDLKPQNVLIDTADQPRITDFGLAKFMAEDSHLTQPGVVMGSPSYMPPEQAEGRHGDIGPHSDVYSLGAMLYEFLTGRPPFRAATVRATLREVIEAEPIAPRRLKSDVPADLETICLKCLEKSTVSRYHSARELADDLERYLHGEPILARPATALRKAMSWGRRHPGILAAAVALVVVSLTIASVYLVEKNVYLERLLQDPSIARAPGPSDLLDGIFDGLPWHADGTVLTSAEWASRDALRNWGMINTAVMLAGFFVLLALHRRARRITWNELFDPAHLTRRREPLGDGMQRLAVGAVLMCVGSGVAFLLKIIHTEVWEEHVPYMNYIGVLGAVWSGLLLAWAVARDYRLTYYGAASRHLNAEQLEGIRHAAERSDWAAAINLYQKAVPDAGILESDQNLRQLFPSLCPPQAPKETPPLLLAALNWRAVMVCALIEAVLAGVASALVFPSAPAMFLCYLAPGLLFGMGYIAGWRVKGFGMQLLMLVPGLAMMVLSHALFLCYLATGHLLAMGLLAGPSVRGFWRWMLRLVPALAMMLFIYQFGTWSADSLALQLGSNFIGLIFGIGLMVSATRRRGLADRPWIGAVPPNS